MLEVLPAIILYIGATSVVELDLCNWDMTMGSCLFTLKNTSINKIIKEVEFSTSKIHQVVFTDEETIKLSQRMTYNYDIMMLAHEERFPQSLISPVEIQQVVGGYNE